MKKAIVSGANGFVGSWLVEKLVENDVHVTAVVKEGSEDTTSIDQLDNVNVVYCDLSNIKSLTETIEDRKFDCFYHLAWMSPGGAGRADYKIQLDNVRYACDVIHVAKKLDCKKVLLAGTVTEHLIEDINLLNPKAQNNIYGVCKHTARCLTLIESEKVAIECIWMQFSNLYGPRSINGNIVGYTISKLLNGYDAEFGPANQVYDLLYIEDLAYAAYLLGFTKTDRQDYYIGSGSPRLLKDYLLDIGRLLGRPEKILIGARDDDGTRYKKEWFDIEALKKTTGFEAKIDFSTGIDRTISWMKEFSNIK